MKLFLRWGVVSTSPNPQTGVPPLVGCPRQPIQYIRSYPSYWRTFVRPQSEDAPCRGDRDPLITGCYYYYYYLKQHHSFCVSSKFYNIILPFESSLTQKFSKIFKSYGRIFLNTMSWLTVNFVLFNSCCLHLCCFQHFSRIYTDWRPSRFYSFSSVKILEV